MAPKDRLQRLKQSALKGAKIAAVVAVLSIFAHASFFQVAILSAAIVLFFLLPSTVIIVSDLLAERKSAELGYMPVEPASKVSQYWFLALVQVMNSIISFFLLLLSAGGDHPEAFYSRGMVAIFILLVTTLCALMMRGTGKGIAVALLSVPLIILFG